MSPIRVRRSRSISPAITIQMNLAMASTLAGTWPRPSEALRELKRRVDGLPTPEQIKEIRAKLKLSQREAGELFKVGENAFDKYERGLIEPSGPTVQLMKLLSKHPELIDELRK